MVLVARADRLIGLRMLAWGVGDGWSPIEGNGKPIEGNGSPIGGSGTAICGRVTLGLAAEDLPDGCDWAAARAGNPRTTSAAMSWRIATPSAVYRNSQPALARGPGPLQTAWGL